MDWNEWEELTPTVETIQAAIKVYRGGVKGAAVETVKREARGAVRTHTPDWKQIADASHLIASPGAAYFQVRLGFEFDLAKAAREAGARFSFVIFSARLWSNDDAGAPPRVYDLYPRDLYQGEPRTVSVEFGPEVTVGEVGASLGKISTDLRIGTVAPVVVAFKGKDEREPRWELTPKEKELIGLRNVWLLVEAPEASHGARLAVRVEGDIETKLGPIPVAPNERIWENRPSVVIQ